ncbi:tRNA-uridine aminocarboxypropyltransferase [Colwelliaceae bacterium BS250]
MHAMHELYLHRKSLSTTEFRARGWKVIRCEICRLAQQNCICDLRTQANSQCSFLLIMADNEVLKPSNTGRLIADVIPDTHAFIWHRTEPNQALLDVLNDQKYQPFLIFPSEYAHPEQVVHTEKPKIMATDKMPLFILIDSTWRQAKRIFRKSDYLANIPMVSIESALDIATTTTSKDNSCDSQPVTLVDVAEPCANESNEFTTNFDSRYQLRKTEKAGQLATAEVAAKVLRLFGDTDSAKLLDLWFDVFSYRYQKGVKQMNKANPMAVANLQSYLDTSKQ